MRLVLKVVGFVMATSVCGVALLGPSYSASGEQVIKERVVFMEEDVYREFKVLAAFAKAGKGSLADVEKSALALASLSKKIPAHFPKDTGRGAYPDHMTRALPAIWTNEQGFQKAVQKMVDESEKLARLAKAGDTEAVVTLIGKSGSYSKTMMGCADCHESFRGARVKK